MPQAPRITYGDRVNLHLCQVNLDTFSPDDLVEEIVDIMEARGETVTNRARGYLRAYFKHLREQRALWKHPINEGLVQPSEKFQGAIDRVRASEVELDYSNITQISLLRVAVGRMKSLTARELRERIIEVMDENDALRAERNALKKELEEAQVERDLFQEERDESQKEIRDLQAEKTRLQAHIVELQAAWSACPAGEGSSTSTGEFHTAPPSPQLGPQQPASGTLSRAPTEIFSPVIPARAPTSRNPSGLPTPPTTDARCPLGRQPSRNDSHSGSGSGSHRSFRENTPGAASVRGATPGSPSRPPRRHSSPLRQLSSQNLDRASPGPTSGSGSGLARGSSYSHIQDEFRELDLFMERQRDERRVYFKRAEERAVEKARARDHEHAQRMQALDNELRLKQKELAKVCGQLEELQEQHRVQTKEYQDLYARYGKLLTRVETLTRMLKELAGEATMLVDEHHTPVMGGTATAGGAPAA
ncbi:hypothetical protein V8D89_002209 [Ganoderma adspersum]